MSGGLSRRTFLTGAVAAAAGVLGSAAGAGARTNARPRPPLVTAPPFGDRHQLTVLRRPVPAGQLPAFIRTGPTNRPLVALTMDDFFGTSGPTDIATVLDVTAAKGVQMSFFPTGGTLEDHTKQGKQANWQRAVRDGHDIGNHTYTHSNVTTLTNAQVTYELSHTADLLAQALGPQYPYTMRLMRPPGGAGGAGTGDARILGILQTFGYSMAMWSIDANGVAAGTSFRDKILSQAQSGSVVLLHPTTLPPGLLGSLIDGLRARKLEPTSISGLFSG